MSKPLLPDRPPTDHDDWVAIVVALGAVGGVLAWTVFQPNWFEGAQTQVQSRPLVGPDFSKSAPPARQSRRDADRPITPIEPEEADTAADLLESSRASAPGLAPSSPTDSAINVNGEPPTVPVQQTLTVPEPTVPAENTVDALAVPPSEPLVFSDLSTDHWGKPYIDALTAQGILAGFPDGTFGPDQAMTRAEFAAQLAEAFDLSAQAETPAFIDLPAQHWAADGIQAAVRTGFMQGYPNAVFQPEQMVPRAQVMAAIAAGLQLSKPTDRTALLSQYPDQTQIPEWAQSPVAAAIAVGIAAPSQTKLRPNQAATRAEVATMIHRALVYLGELPPVE